MAGGVVVGDPCRDFRWYHFGGYKANFASDLEAIFVGRPFLESEVRRRVLALPNLARRLECDAEGLTATADRAAVWQHNPDGMFATFNPTVTCE